jgi:hypothetical protein
LGEVAEGINCPYKDVDTYIALSYKVLGDTENAKITLAEATHYETPFDEKHDGKQRKMYEEEYIMMLGKE